MKLDAQRLVGVLKRPSSLLILAGAFGLGLIFLSDGMDRTSDTAQAPAASVQIQAYEAQMERRLTDLIERMTAPARRRSWSRLRPPGKPFTHWMSASARTAAPRANTFWPEGSPVTREMLLPTVQGVAVLCQGGDDVEVRRV